ncbi:MAG: GDP-mannose 4,6-dehydratase [Dehalococcoidia bacterium]
MKVLITGGCGFLGTNLTGYLVTRGHEIKVLDNLSTAFPSWRSNLSAPDSRLPNVDLVKGDIRNRETVNDAVAGVNAVIHLAALTSVVESVEDPEETWEINVQGTLNLLEACRRHKAERFIFASSNAVAGEQTPPIDENKVPQPLSPYGASKLAGEALCSAYWHSFGIKTVSLRFANLYGPFSEHKTSVIALFLQWISGGKPLIIYGDGKQTRDFIHAEDVCQAVHLSLTSGGPFGEVFQIASGKETSVNKLVKALEEVTGKESEVIHQPERMGEIRRNFSDITKARKMMGFEPEIELIEGLKRLS